MDRLRAIWTISFAYVAYLFLGEVPQLSKSSLFSEQDAFVLLVALYLVSSYVIWGKSSATKFLLLTWVVSYTVEFIGTRTGYPFGHYAYTTALGPALGPVPVFIPFLWCALGYFCLLATGRSVLSAAILMVILDVSLDPIFGRELWHWQSTPGPEYFGVPVLNFAGWFVTSGVIFALFRALDPQNDSRGLRSFLHGCGSRAATVFYFLFGVTTVLFDLSAGMSEAAGISFLLYLFAFGAVWWASSASKRMDY